HQTLSRRQDGGRRRFDRHGARDLRRTARTRLAVRGNLRGSRGDSPEERSRRIPCFASRNGSPSPPLAVCCRHAQRTTTAIRPRTTGIPHLITAIPTTTARLTTITVTRRTTTAGARAITSDRPSASTSAIATATAIAASGGNRADATTTRAFPVTRI